MVIGICEDRATDRIRIENACTNFMKRRNEHFEVKKFCDGQEVLEYGDKLDLLFLDIEMPRVDGIKVKEMFQRWNKATMILYVTVHDELMKSAFGMNVYGFIHKNSLENHLEQILPSALEVLQNYVLIDNHTDSRDVVYIKAEGVYCRLVMENGREELVRISMKKAEEMLQGVGYIRTHKSYLVNSKWVTKWEDGRVLTKKDEVPISGRLRTKAKKQYEDYCRKNAGYC